VYKSKAIVVLSCLALGMAAPAIAENATTSTAAAAFQKLLDEEWEYGLRESPEFATYVGDSRYNDRWSDISEEAIERRRAHARDLLPKLKQMAREQLPPRDQLHYDLYLRDAELEVEGERFRGEYMPITQMGGVHMEVAETARLAPRATVKDFEDQVARLRGVPKMVDQTIVLMRKGLETGITPPQAVLSDVERQIGNQIFDEPTSSPIYEIAFAEMPASLAEADRERLRSEARTALREHVMPSFRKLQTFWRDEYVSHTRTSIAATDLPDGKAWYAYRVKRSTTTNQTPDEIHEIGMQEVKRIRGEMEKIREQVGFTGDLPAFFQHLRTDPKFFFTDPKELLMGYRDICKRVDPELPKLFRTLPRLTYGVQPVPKYSEKTQPTAYYWPGSLKAGRAGMFFANTYSRNTRPKWETQALTLHEAVPGHHLQIALAQELGDVPEFRKHAGYTAFVEGWGLYAESLGDDLGMYKDPYSKFGQLTYEMWRSIRLVVDTGMHAKGWSRDKARGFFMQNAGKSEHDIGVEVDRYVVWPGQALAYKIGQLKIKELRERARAKMGDKFSVRSFHEHVLGSGALPLDILEQRIDRWMNEPQAN